MEIKKTKLYIPGPVEVRDYVLKDMGVPMIGHRSKEYSQLHSETVPKLQKLLYTGNDVFLGTHSATGWMEAAVRNCVEKKCLNLVCGAFSERWNKITTECGKEADTVTVEWGKAIKPEMVREKLEAGKYDCLTLVHNETSTAVMNPLEDIAQIMKDFPEIVFCVDAVSSMAGVKIEVDKLGIDVCLAGMQKAFGLPPGLAVCAVSQKALDKAEKVKNRGHYLDFLAFKKSSGKNQTPTTPAISLIYALNKQLDRIFEEGFENRIKRHEKMALTTQEWAKKNFALFAEPGYESKTLTAVANTRNISVADLNSELAKQNYMISNGYGKIKEKTFRIAHMADRKPAELKELLATIDGILEGMK